MVGRAAAGQRDGAEHRLVQVGLLHPLQQQWPKDRAEHLEGRPLLVGRLLSVDLGQPLHLGTGAGQEAAEEFRARRTVLQQDTAQVATRHRVRAEDPGGDLPERNHQAPAGFHGVQVAELLADAVQHVLGDRRTQALLGAEVPCHERR
ncbi:hypothetical protein [Streptomyces mirabilis]|uniref:hypothetical protein n=1 Tax=Streptomyces mirabilis TaxID=68239 RepID=UPI00368476F5